MSRGVLPEYSWLKCPEWLLKALKQVAGDPAPIDNRPLIKGKMVVWDFRRIDWGPGVWQMHNDFEFEIRSMPSVQDREVWIRTPEIALRLATILAVFRGSTMVEASDFEWGIALAKQSTKFIQTGMTKHMLEEYEQADLVEHIREEFRHRVISPMPKAPRGVLTQGQIRKYCERKCKDLRQIDAATYHLLITEEIIEVDINGVPIEDATSVRTAGRPTHRYKWVGR